MLSSGFYGIKRQGLLLLSPSRVSFQRGVPRLNPPPPPSSSSPTTLTIPPCVHHLTSIARLCGIAVFCSQRIQKLNWKKVRSCRYYSNPYVAYSARFIILRIFTLKRGFTNVHEAQIAWRECTAQRGVTLSFPYLHSRISIRIPTLLSPLSSATHEGYSIFNYFYYFIAFVIDNDDGTYTVSYQPLVRGNHRITVTMRNININGSPFNVNVTGRMDFGKVGKVMACFGCEGTGGGKKT